MGGRADRRAVRGSLLGLVASLLLLPLASSAAGVPVVLVYGFQPLIGFQPLQLWQAFAESWSGRPIDEAVQVDLETAHTCYVMPAVDDAHTDVVISNYAPPLEPTVRSLRYYAGRLSDEVAWTLAAFGVPQVDIVAHSMGGLVARCVIEASDFSGSANPFNDDVRTLVTLAAPHHGAELALVPLWIGPITDDLRPSSDVLTALNANGLSPAVRYVSMAGETCMGCSMSRDTALCFHECAEQALAGDGSDLVVSMNSAWLAGAENTACIGMNHVDMRCHPVLAEAVARILRGEHAPLAVFASDELRAAAAAGP